MNLDDARLVPAAGESGLAVRHPGVVLYCAERQPADVVADLLGRCRKAAMSDEPGVVLIRQLAGLVTGSTRESLPSFAAIASTNRGLAVLVTGQLEVEVVTEQGEEHLSGATSVTYVDRLVTGDCHRLSVHRPGDHPIEVADDLDLVQGVTAAGGIDLESPMVEASAPPDTSGDQSYDSVPPPAAAPPPSAPPAEPGPPSAAPPSAAAPPAPAPPPAPAAPPPGPSVPPTPPAPPPSAAPVAPAPATPAPASTPPPPASTPPPPAPTPPPPASPSPPAAGATPPPPPPPPAPAAPPAEPAAERAADFDFVLLGAVDEDEDHDLEPLPIEPDPAEARESDSSAGQVMVRGTICSRGHFNDPRSRFCSSCGISMVHQTLNLVSGVRPPLGVLVFEDGTTYSLSANYVIGRQPDISSLIQSGDALPLLLTDTGRTISRVHAELRLQEWDVYFVNLSATNGSFLFDRQTSQWRALPTSEPIKLEPGSRLAMGGRVAVFESSLVR